MLRSTFIGYEDGINSYGVFRYEGKIKLITRNNCPGVLSPGDQAYLVYRSDTTGGDWYVLKSRTPPGDWRNHESPVRNGTIETVQR